MPRLITIPIMHLARLAVLLAVLGLALGLPVSGMTAGQGTHVPGQFIEDNPVSLRSTSYAEGIDALVTSGAEQQSFLDVAGSGELDGAFADQPACDTEFGEEPLDPGITFGPALCWNNEYWSQGITGSSESHWADVQDRNLVLVSWHSEGGDEHGRLTIVDAGTGRFRHILMVTPDLQPLITHAGGLAWVGQHLYLADTEGMIEFDLGNFFVDPADGETKLVASAKWETTNSPFRISTLSAVWDGETPSLVAANYSSTVGSTVNAYHWPLDAEGALVVDDNDVARSNLQFVAQGVSHVQGVAIADTRYFFNESANDTLITVDSVSGTVAQYDMPHYNVQDMYWDEQRGVMWSLTEGPATERDDAPLAAGQTDRLEHVSWMTYLFSYTVPTA